MEFDELINEVTQLSEKDKRRLLLFLEQTSSNSPSNTNSDHIDRIYSLMTAQLKQHGIYKCPSLKRVVQVLPSFKEDVEIFLKFAVKRQDSPKKKLERIKVINYLLSIMYRVAKENNEIVTFWNYAKLLPYINQIFDNAYPGYAQAGLAHMVFNTILGETDGN